MEVTPLMIYFIGIVDHVRDFSAISLILLFVIFLIFFVCFVEYDDKIPYLRAITFSAVILSLLLILVPNSKTLASMYVIPAVLNNEQIQNIGKNELESLELLTKQWVDELREEKSKKDN